MSSFALLLSEVGESLLRWTVFMNLWIGALFCLALIFDRALRGHISATNRMLLYAPIFIRLVLPIGWVSPLSFTPEFSETDNSRYTARQFVDSPATQTSTEESRRLLEKPLVSAEVATTSRSNIPSTMKDSKSWGVILIYLLGIGFIGTIRLIRFRRMKKFMREAYPTQLDLGRLPPGLLPPEIRLLEHKRIGPLVYGTINPTIVIPTAIISTLSDTDLECIIAHEMAHLKRRDPLFSLVMRTVTFLLWPVFALWLTVRRLHRLAEVACDDAAVRRLPTISYRGYGEVLIRVADLRFLHNRFVDVSNRFIGSELKERITALGSGRNWHTLFQKGLILAIAAVITASSGVVEQPALGQQGFPGDRVQDLSELELADIELKFADAPSDLHLCQQLVQGYYSLASDWYNRFRSAYSTDHLEKMDEYLEKTRQMSDKAWHYAQTLMAPYDDERLEAMRSGETAFRQWLQRQFDASQAYILHDIGTAWVTTIAYSDQMHRIVDLHFAEAMLLHSVDLAPDLLSSQGLVVLGMAKCKLSGILNPEITQQGYELLETALRLTNGENQMIRVNIAEYCAPALGDRELFIRSLHEVLNSSPSGRFSRSNQRARELSQHLMEEIDSLIPDFK